VDAGGGVGAHELANGIDPHAVTGVGAQLFLGLGHFAVVGDDNLIAVDGGDFAGVFRHQDGARIAGDALFQAGGHKRRFGHEQRDGLALHVGAHQGAVGVVVLEEWNQAGGDRNELLGRNVHVVHPGGLDVDEVALGAASDAIGQEIAFVIDGRVGLGDDIVFLAVGGEVVKMICDAAFFDLAVG